MIFSRLTTVLYKLDHSFNPWEIVKWVEKINIAGEELGVFWRCILVEDAGQGRFR